MPDISDLDFADVYNDIRSYPNLSAVASKLGLAVKTVKNRAGLMRARRLTDATIPELVSRRAQAAHPLPEGVEHRAIETYPIGAEEPIEDLIARAIAHSERVATHAHEATCIDLRLNVRGPFGVVGIPDNHLENPNTLIRRMFDDAYMIAQHPHLFCVCIGDFLDNFIIGRLEKERRKTKMSTSDAWRLLEHYLDILAPKIIAASGGNHDAWVKDAGGVDVLQRLFEERGLGPIYHSDQVRVRLRTPNGDTYTHLARHKYRGSSQYNSLHAITKWILERWQGEDVIWGGHIHQAGHVALQKDWMGVSRVVHGIQLGTYKANDPYAIREAFRPNQPFLTPMIIHVPETQESLFFEDIQRGVAMLSHIRRELGYSD